MHDYWHKQTPDKPLFPDLLWSRPENRAHAGKLLIVGGNAHSFAAAGEAYTEATQAGIGAARVLLPDSLQKTVGRVFEAGEYAPSTPSGSFGRRALAELLESARWADGVVLAGDLGRNSETAALLEEFTRKYSQQLTITGDALDYYITGEIENLVTRPETTLVLDFAQLQKLGKAMRTTTAFRSTMDLVQCIEALHQITATQACNIIVAHLDTLCVAVDGQITTQPINASSWRASTAAHAAVWWLQNPRQTFQALSTSICENSSIE